MTLPLLMFMFYIQVHRQKIPEVGYYTFTSRKKTEKNEPISNPNTPKKNITRKKINLSKSTNDLSFAGTRSNPREIRCVLNIKYVQIDYW